MDLPVPYEITSDQDVASMFVISVSATSKDSACGEKPSEYYFKSTNGEKGDLPLQSKQEEIQMESSLQTDSTLSDLNPSGAVGTSPNNSSLKTRILSLEPNDMDTYEHSGTIKESLHITHRVKSTDFSNNTTKRILANTFSTVKLSHQKQSSTQKAGHSVKCPENPTDYNESQNNPNEVSPIGRTFATTNHSTRVGSSQVSRNNILSPKAPTAHEHSSRSQEALHCPTCRHNFPLDADLTWHHCDPHKGGEEILSCTICKTMFEEMDKLKDHMRKHWESLPYKCHVCCERYWTEKSLKRHLIKHETRDKPFACVECNVKYVHKRQLLLHMANIHSRDRATRKYPCEICGRNFLRKCDLTKHVKKCVDLEEESHLLERDPDISHSDNDNLSPVSPGTTTEGVCGLNESLPPNQQSSSSKSEHYAPPATSPKAVGILASHPAEKGINPPTSLSKESNNFLVPATANRTSDLMNIFSNIQGSGIPAIAPYFNIQGLGQNMSVSPLFSMLPLLPVATFVGQTSLSTESLPTTARTSAGSRHDGIPPCHMPTARLSSRRKSKQPRRTISTLLDDLPSKPDLGEKMVDVVEIIRRSKKHTRMDDRVQDPKEGALYNCQRCSRSFPTLCELRLHCESHGSNIFSCKYCKKLLSSQVSLYRHEADHEDNRPFRCDLCDKAFVLKAELNRHIDIQHSKRPFTCNICRFNFSCQANLDAHMPVHIEKRSCPLCPRSFTTETYLQRHIAKLHVSNNETVEPV